MTTYDPKSTVGTSDDESVTCSRHLPCGHCGKAGHAHNKRKVFPDDGPAGSYHYRYECP